MENNMEEKFYTIEEEYIPKRKWQNVVCDLVLTTALCLASCPNYTYTKVIDEVNSIELKTINLDETFYTVEEEVEPTA